MSPNRHCVICRNTLDPTDQKYCYNCRSTGAHVRLRVRRRANVENDGHNFLGEATGAVRWVKVLYCPKGDLEDAVPMFTPGYSKFSFDQFLVGLKDSVWPVGMRVEVEFFRYSKTEVEGRRMRYAEVKRYIVNGDGKGLIHRLEKEQRRFVKKAEEYFKSRAFGSRTDDRDGSRGREDGGG